VPVEDEVDDLGGTAASLLGIVENVGLRRVRPGFRVEQPTQEFVVDSLDRVPCGFNTLARR
jgi:hypothetical protein